MRRLTNSTRTSSAVGVISAMPSSMLSIMVASIGAGALDLGGALLHLR